MARRFRIGELAQRTGVSADGLRAWERRYALLRPERSDGGYRLYTPEDEERVRAMVRHVDSGVPAAEAARLVLEGTGSEGAEGPPLQAYAGDLRQALDRFDDAGAQAALDRLTGTLSFETVAREVILPYLRELGDRWERGEATVAQEHFASIVLRGRLLALARGWDRGTGPRALLACAPGEQHELGLIVFGLALRQHGWGVTYLGADTPVETLAAAAEQLQPAAVVVVALTPERLEPIQQALSKLGRRARLVLAGAGAAEDFAASVGAELLHGDPVTAASELAR
jgi:DNA-binding transcriptional MerR regulator/methylmalonyl-CoA mutase cobalamin-binding subunit